MPDCSESAPDDGQRQIVVDVCVHSGQVGLHGIDPWSAPSLE
jgi:hypothetical protein